MNKLTNILVYHLVATAALLIAALQVNAVTILDSDMLQLAEVTAPQPWQQVRMHTSAPTTSNSNKPFFVTYRFGAPVSGFTRSLITIQNGKLTYFSANKTKTIFRLQVVPTVNLDSGEEPTTNIVIAGELNRSIKIIGPQPQTSKKSKAQATGDGKFSFLGQFTLGKGGDKINAAGSQVGDTNSLQIGFASPLPGFLSWMYNFLPQGDFRFHLGREWFSSGSKSKDYNNFSATNADFLYQVTFTPTVKIIGGMTYVHQPKLVSENMQLKDIQGTFNAEIQFKNASGFKLLTEYSPSINSIYYVNAGLSIIDYVPNTMSIKGGTNVSQVPSSVRVNGSSFKLGFGISF